MTGRPQRGVRFTMRDGDPLTATSGYVAPDYELVAGPGGEVPVGAHRLSIDTLTLAFTADDHTLVAVDAYTNPQLWAVGPLDPPVEDAAGPLVCLESFDENGIAPSRPGPVTFEYEPARSLVLVRISTGDTVRRVRFLTCAVAGLTADDALTEIWLEGVEL